MLTLVMMIMVIIIILDIRSVGGVSACRSRASALTRDWVRCHPEPGKHTADAMKHKTEHGATLIPAAGNLSSTTANVKPILRTKLTPNPEHYSINLELETPTTKPSIPNPKPLTMSRT